MKKKATIYHHPLVAIAGCGSEEAVEIEFHDDAPPEPVTRENEAAQIDIEAAILDILAWERDCPMYGPPEHDDVFKLREILARYAPKEEE